MPFKATRHLLSNQTQFKTVLGDAKKAKLTLPGEEDPPPEYGRSQKTFTAKKGSASIWAQADAAYAGIKKGSHNAPRVTQNKLLDLLRPSYEAKNKVIARNAANVRWAEEKQEENERDEAYAGKGGFKIGEVEAKRAKKLTAIKNGTRRTMSAFRQKGGFNILGVKTGRGTKPKKPHQCKRHCICRYRKKQKNGHRN